MPKPKPPTRFRITAGGESHVLSGDFSEIFQTATTLHHLYGEVWVSEEPSGKTVLILGAGDKRPEMVH